MARGELFIRNHSGITAVNGSLSGGWVDAWLQWGVSLSEPSLSALMAPAPNKPCVETKSRVRHGKQIVSGPGLVRKDERNVSLEMHITASTRAEFWDRYDRFCSEVLDYGELDLRVCYSPSKVFRMTYESCSQFKEYGQRIAKFTLRLNEPDPSDRGLS